MDDKSLLDTLEDSFLDLADGAVELIPKLLVALLLVLVGVVIARFIARLVGGFVDYIENSKPVTNSLKELGIKSIDVDGVVAMFVRWAIILVFVGAAVDVLGFAALTDTFNALIAFVPNIFAAAVIAALSFVAANTLRDLVDASAKSANIAAHKFLGSATKVVVLIFGFPFAIAQLGLDMTIITNNLTVIVAGFMLAFGLAFGMGGREVASKIVDDMYKSLKK